MLHIKLTYIQIDLRTLNPRHIIAIFRQNADRRVHVERHPLIKRSTMMAAAAATAARVTMAVAVTAVATTAVAVTAMMTRMVAAAATASHQWQQAQAQPTIN